MHADTHTHSHKHTYTHTGYAALSVPLPFLAHKKQNWALSEMVSGMQLPLPKIIHSIGF